MCFLNTNTSFMKNVNKSLLHDESHQWRMESVLDHTGRWQIGLLVLVGSAYVIVAFNHTLPTFHGYTPPYHCCLPNDEGNVTRVDGCVSQAGLCPGGYEFESPRDEQSIVTEWNLVCDRRHLWPLATTLYFCGVTIGALACGMLADRFGRKPVLLICLYSQGVLGLTLYATYSLEAYIVVRFIQGFFVQGLQGSTYTLLMELFPPAARTAVGIVLEVYWAAGLVLLAGVSYLIPDWRFMQLALTVPTVLTLLFVCFIPESSRWLTTRGSHQSAADVLTMISRRNGNKTQLSTNQVLEARPLGEGESGSESDMKTASSSPTQGSHHEKIEHFNGVILNNSPSPEHNGKNGACIDLAGGTTRKCGILDLFRNKVLRKYNFIMVFNWFSISLSYYGILFYLPVLSGNRHLNFFLGAVLEAISYCAAYFVLSRYGRRVPLAVYLMLSGALCVTVGGISVVQGTSSSLAGLQTVLALLGKAAVVSAFCSIFLYTSELFPTTVRAAAMGYCGFWGRIGSLLSPQLLLLGEYTSNLVPLVTMGVLVILAGCSTLLLPETLGRPLANTIEQAEEMHIKRKGNK